MHARTSVFLAAVVCVSALSLAAASQDSGLKAEVERSLSNGDFASSRISVAVDNGVVTLTGTVPSVGVKLDAVTRARKIKNVTSVIADLSINAPESDNALAAEVVKRILGYSRYSVYDDIEGSVHNGAVTLTGQVTEPKKSSEIDDVISHIQGVHDVDNKIQVLPSSQSDNRLRTDVAERIYQDPAFENYSMATPPIHVIVSNNIVTLVGVVRAEEERHKAEAIARATPGVRKVDNQVRLASELNGPGGA